MISIGMISKFGLKLQVLNAFSYKSKSIENKGKRKSSLKLKFDAFTHTKVSNHKTSHVTVSLAIFWSIFMYTYSIFERVEFIKTSKLFSVKIENKFKSILGIGT